MGCCEVLWVGSELCDEGTSVEGPQHTTRGQLALPGRVVLAGGGLILAHVDGGGMYYTIY